jgi:excisionase family DNA binding protein
MCDGLALPYGCARRWLTFEQVCDWMQLSEGQLRGMVDRRSIPFRKVGQKLRFPEDELEVWSRPKPTGQETTRVKELQPLVLVPRVRKKWGTGSSLPVRYDGPGT